MIVNVQNEDELVTTLVEMGYDVRVEKGLFVFVNPVTLMIDRLNASEVQALIAAKHLNHPVALFDHSSFDDVNFTLVYRFDEPSPIAPTDDKLINALAELGYGVWAFEGLFEVEDSANILHPLDVTDVEALIAAKHLSHPVALFEYSVFDETHGLFVYDFAEDTDESLPS